MILFCFPIFFLCHTVPLIGFVYGYQYTQMVTNMSTPNEKKDEWYGMKAIVTSDGLCHFENGMVVDSQCPIEEENWRNKKSYSEIGTVGGFRWIKSDGSIGQLKDGETMSISNE